MSTVLYHNDQDGRCAASIARTAYPELYPVVGSYDGNVHWEKFRYGDLVVVADMRFNPTTMIRLANNYRLIHIDHHLPNEEELAELQAAKYNPSGIRPTTKPIDKSASLLSWEYFFKDKPVPHAVKLIDDYDLWKFKYPDTLAFHYGLETVDHGPRNLDLWERLFNDDPGALDFIRMRGEELLGFILPNNKICCHDLCYETTLEDYTVLAVNTRAANSSLFDGYVDKSRHDFMLMYAYIGSIGLYRCSLYPAKSELNADKLAQIYGGGGHPGAAGFSCKDLPFTQREGTQPKVPLFSNVYAEMEDYLATSNVAKMYIRKSQRLSIMSQYFISQFEDQPCVVVNSPLTAVELFFALDSVTCPVAISYVWTNIGQYRVIIHPLMRVANLEIFKEKYKGRMVDGSLWFYCDELPFQLCKRIK